MMPYLFQEKRGIEKVLGFVFTKAYGEDDLRADLDDIGTFKWFPIVSFTFHYQPSESDVKLMERLLRYGAPENRLYLDFM